MPRRENFNGPLFATVPQLNPFDVSERKRQLWEPSRSINTRQPQPFIYTDPEDDPFRDPYGGEAA